MTPSRTCGWGAAGREPGLVMRDTATTVVTLVMLRALGVQIAIDDFGTGSSSLAYRSIRRRSTRPSWMGSARPQG